MPAKDKSVSSRERKKHKTRSFDINGKYSSKHIRMRTQSSINSITSSNTKNITTDTKTEKNFKKKEKRKKKKVKNN